jgi:hypothetical protein
MHTSPSVEESVMRVIAIVIGIALSMLVVGCSVGPRDSIDLAAPKVR